MNDITISRYYTFDKLKILIVSFVITIAIGISIYYAIDLTTDKPIDVPKDITTDIDWSKPPCNPNDLSNNWREITDPRMVEKSSRRIFQYKNTDIKVAFEKGKPGLTGDKANDHWHRYNPNLKNNRDLYLDIYGNPTGKGSSSSHIDPNCN